MGRRAVALDSQKDSNLRKGQDIAERCVALSVAVLALARAMPQTPTARHIASQLIRCGTSGGANYEEARAAESRADFIHKLRVAGKEMRETMFWLRLAMHEALPDDVSIAEIDDLVREANELTAILIASARTARGKKD